MPKSNLIRDVEEIANRISRKNIKESRAIIQLGTWVKNLVDELKVVKQRLDELDIRVKKINAYGATVLTPKEAAEEQRTSGPAAPKVKPGDLKRYRLLRKLSQAAMGALLGATQQKYARWESGKSIMVTQVEDKFREIQGIKGRELRTKLQELGYFQATGKKTRFRKGQEESTPAPAKPAPRAASSRRPVASAIISTVQLRELRLALGYTHAQMAELMHSKPKHYSNWEYGACRPPEQIAKKLLALYQENVAKSVVPDPGAPAEPYHRPTSSRKIYESPLLPIAKIRAGRAASGLTCAKVAEKLGVPLTTYKNWESGNSTPPAIQIEKMIQLFGNPPTPSVQASTKRQAAKHRQRTKHSEGYPIPAEELRAFRLKLGLTMPQFAALLKVNANQYRNWEHHGRGVPPAFVSKVKILQKMSREKLQRLYSEVGMSVFPAAKGTAE